MTKIGVFILTVIIITQWDDKTEVKLNWIELNPKWESLLGANEPTSKSRSSKQKNPRGDIIHWIKEQHQEDQGKGTTKFIRIQKEIVSFYTNDIRMTANNQVN